MSFSHLPTPLSPIVGRGSELAELAGLMSSSRLITLTGAGGSGKTRLALEAVSRFAAEASPAWVDLAPLVDGGLLSDHVSRALEVRGDEMAGVTQALTHSLKTRSSLLVLDNCEHLVEACARLVEVLLRFCAPLRILTTSREPLGLPGERIWLVPPLALPPASAKLDLEALEASDAVRFFLERAREASPSFRLTESNAAAVLAICRRLDGLPLALELAAARTRVLSVEQIAERLDDSFRLLTTGGRTSLPRQKTLRGAIDWSHDLLNEEEQVLLRRLSVFLGGFSLEAVEAVAQGGVIDDGNVLDALAALVDRSLVQLEPESEPARYRLLEVVRQYGRERLRAAGEEETLRRCHAEYFLALAESWGPRIFLGTDDEALMAAVDRDHDNLRATHDWGMSPEGEVDVALRIGVALHWYWYFRGHLLEGWRRIESAIAWNHEAKKAGAVETARAVVALGLFAVVRGEPQDHSSRIAEAVEKLAAAPTAELAYALGIQAAIESYTNPPKGLAAAEQALALLADKPDDILKGFALHWQGVNALALQQVDKARAATARAVVIGHERGHAAAIAHSSFVRALIEFLVGNLELSRCYLGESLRAHARMGTQFGIEQGLRLFGAIAARSGEPQRALQLYGAAEAMREDLGTPLPAREQAALDESMEALRAALGEDRERMALFMSQGAALSLAQRIALALEAEPAAASVAVLTPPPPVSAEKPAAAAAPAQKAPSGLVAEGPPLRPPALAEQAANMAVEAPAAALRVAALGRLRVEVAGAPLLEAAGAVRTRELLVFLLLSPDGATKDEVGVALWPEASASQVRNSFHVTLHRLRGALGAAEAIKAVGNRYAVDPAFLDSFDVALFEEKVKAGLAAAKAGRGEIEGLLASLELYGGELLEGESAGEWHLERRDQLQQLYLEALEVAGGGLQKAGRWAEAAEVYRRWIVADDLCEEAYRQRMRCLEATGEAQEALRLYRKLVKVLERELDVEPEPATREIYERLVAKS